MIGRHPSAWIAGAAAVVFLLLATAALFAGASFGSSEDAAATPVSETSAPGRVAPEEVPEATRLRTCTVAALASDPALVGLTAAVTNASTGELLLDRAAGDTTPQAGASQVLTAAAAISILGADTTLSTKVYEGASPKTIVLVGSGDPTITALESGSSVYSGAARLSDLAEQVLDNYSGDIENIVLDSTLWNPDDKWDASWPRSAQTGGSQSEVTALQVDGDRADPTQQTSPRSTDPVARAGVLFADALGLDASTVTFSRGSAVTTKPMLGSVASQPVSVLVNQMLMQNDGTLAENLARLVSTTGGYGGTGASLQQAITSGLAAYGVPTTGLVIQDGSGLSESTTIPPRFLAAFMATVRAGQNGLNYIYNSLPVAGVSGGLAVRFTGDSAAAKSQVVAIPGSLGGYSLAGVVLALDGSQLAFSFTATGAGVTDSARAALDALATGVFTCGDNLSNN